MTVQEQNLKTKNVLIMASGNGSNFEAIVRHFDKKGFTAIYPDKTSSCRPHGDKILGKPGMARNLPENNPQKNTHGCRYSGVKFTLIVDKKDAFALKRAEKLGIPAFFVEFNKLHEFLSGIEHQDLYVLAGFMRILPEKILKFGTFINIHPSLLPKFKGKNAIRRAFEAKVKKTGVTVHFVNSKVDSGKIIEQRAIQTNGLSFEDLEAEIHNLEHNMYPKIIENLLFKKNVLLFGGGAREHAMAQRLAVSPYLRCLFLANANDGFKDLGQNIEFTDYFDLLNKAHERNIDLLVVGPENPLCDGIVDIFSAKGIKCIGANKDWARLEGSKIFAKEFMLKHDIKTADYKAAHSEDGINTALTYFKNRKNLAGDDFHPSNALQAPVIKADGLALGKGVYLSNDFDDAKIAAKEFIYGKFSDASRRILIEERLSGKEISVMSLWDGQTLVSFPPASDYKRLLDGNKGENTGGMGSYAPNKLSKREKVLLAHYLKQLENALRAECADFCGVIYSGLMLANDDIYVLEYNIRFGDPEIQSLLELLDNDLLDIFIKMTEKRLNELQLKFRRKTAYCVVLASEGYPFNPKKGALISGLDNACKNSCKLYFAGVKDAAFPIDGVSNAAESRNSFTSALLAIPSNSTEQKYTFQKKLLTNGGRVLSIVKSGKNALKDIYKTAQEIKFDGKVYRKDIGE